ncbi:MAG TPA: hypothetical protein VKA84_05585, partial [Gemmatimonadaceae bacterium]|nr:hypothetical protein [Gemmatimonadaceae bacterium]
MRASVVGAQQGVSDQVLAVRVYYFRQTEETVDLLNERIPVNAEEETRSLTVDIYPCLRDTLRSSFGQSFRRDRSLALAAATAQRAAPPAEATCDVIIEIGLLVNETEVDRTVVGSVPLTPGGRTEVEAPTLFAGITKPGLLVQEGPTAVDLQLIRLALTASDPDRNLASLELFHVEQSRFA